MLVVEVKLRLLGGVQLEVVMRHGCLRIWNVVDHDECETAKAGGRWIKKDK
jgi:hypothetical protein